MDWSLQKQNSLRTPLSWYICTFNMMALDGEEIMHFGTICVLAVSSVREVVLSTLTSRFDVKNMYYIPDEIQMEDSVYYSCNGSFSKDIN